MNSAFGLLKSFGTTRRVAAPPSPGSMEIFTWPNNPGITAHTVGASLGPTQNQMGVTYSVNRAARIGAIWLQANATLANGTLRIWRVSDQSLLWQGTVGGSESQPLPAAGTWLVVDLDTPVDVAANEEFTVTYQGVANVGLRILASSVLGPGITRVGSVNQAGTGFPSTPNVNILSIGFDLFAEWDHAAAGMPDAVDLFLVGAGGAGGSGFTSGGGGGGAGQVRALTAVSVAGSELVFVGSGQQINRVGGASYFGASVALGGGAGGGRAGFSNGPGMDGGSGGGGGMATSATPTPGGTSLGALGNDGGDSTDPTGSTTRRASGGGGGAGSAGGEPVIIGTTRRGGDGGDGVTLASLGWSDAVLEGAPPTVAGGGGGGAAADAAGSGTGGSGIGGNGSQSTTATNGAPHTGSGGGGGNNQAGQGGSGLVIVRW